MCIKVPWVHLWSSFFVTPLPMNHTLNNNVPQSLYHQSGFTLTVPINSATHHASTLVPAPSVLHPWHTVHHLIKHHIHTVHHLMLMVQLIQHQIILEENTIHRHHNNHKMPGYCIHQVLQHLHQHDLLHFFHQHHIHHFHLHNLHYVIRLVLPIYTIQTNTLFTWTFSHNLHRHYYHH